VFELFGNTRVSLLRTLGELIATVPAQGVLFRAKVTGSPARAR
jgi:hypothetical protein